MTGTLGDPLTAGAAFVLVGALAYAAWHDVKEREVDDAVWLLAALAGAILVALSLIGSGALAVGLWVLVAALVVQHLVAWDERMARWNESLPGVLEAVAYAGVGVVLLAVAVERGVGSNGVPLEVIAAYVTVLIARALFELGILYGGADAKALMASGAILPILASPLAQVPATASGLLSIYPFPLTLLMDAALLAVAVPIYLAVRNLARGDAEFPCAFVAYRLPVRELPERFVWLKDPTFRGEERDRDAETSEEDHEIRERQAQELTARGVSVVWVTPQLPFVVLLAAGAVAAILFGNLLFDLLALL